MVVVIVVVVVVVVVVVRAVLTYGPNGHLPGGPNKPHKCFLFL